MSDITLNDIRKIYDLARYSTAKGMLKATHLDGRIEQDNLPEDIDDFFESLGVNKDVLIFLAEIFAGNFVDGLDEGPGIGLDLSDDGEVSIILDVIKVRNKIATAQDQYQTLKCSNGSLVISNSAKLKFVRRKEMI